MEKNEGQPSDSDIRLLHNCTDHISALNMDMNTELYKQTYTKVIDNRIRLMQDRLEFIDKVKENAHIIRRLQTKFKKKEKKLSQNIDQILDSTVSIDYSDMCLDEIFNDSKNIFDESKLEGLSAVLLPEHIGIWDKTKESYKNSIQLGNNSKDQDPKSRVFSHMIESGTISLPSPPASTL